MLLIPNTGTGTDEDRVEHPPAGSQRIELSRYTSLERLSLEDYDVIRAACLPRGHFFIATPQSGFLYAYVFEIPQDEWERNRFGWDPAGELVAILGFSRLIVDNAHTTQYAARLVEYEDGERQVIPFLGPDAAIAFRAYPDQRDWIDSDEAADLADLLTKVLAGGTVRLPARVARAMWMQESSVRLRYADVALPILITGLEALINTGDAQPTKQFTHRVSALAHALAIQGVSKARCSRIYHARSQGVHGAPIDLLSGAQHDTAVDDMATMQAVLRGAIRRAADEPELRQAFETPETVRARWPVGCDGDP